jgi:hypothetical protein
MQPGSSLTIAESSQINVETIASRNAKAQSF